MDIEQLAIKAGVLYVDDTSTYYTTNNAIQALDDFARRVIKAYLYEQAENITCRQGSI